MDAISELFYFFVDLFDFLSSKEKKDSNLKNVLSYLFVLIIFVVSIICEIIVIKKLTENFDKNLLLLAILLGIIAISIVYAIGSELNEIREVYNIRKQLKKEGKK